MRRTARSGLLALCLLLPALAAAQSRAPFTAEDMLNVSSVSILDMTEDGRRIAASIRRPLDSPATDHRRYGDPTYVAPARVTVRVIDSRTGTFDEPFEDLVNVREAAWSRDGRRLAMLVARDAADPGGIASIELHVWDAERKALARVPLQSDQRISSTSTLTWAADGSAVLLALRHPRHDQDVRQRFNAITEGPVIVHRSSEPFLEWDLLRRSARTSTLATVDVTTGAVRTVVPEARISSHRASRDGSFLTILEDVTEKTDYDTIGGTDNTLKYVDARSGETRTIAPAKDLKGLQLRWSDDGRWFAYGKRGEVFVQGVDGSAARNPTPKPRKADEADKDKTVETPAAEDKPDEESFSPVSFSRDARKLLITSRKGWYVLTVANGTRELLVPMDEDEDKNPRLSAIDWAPDGSAIYATWSARGKWERGIVRIDLATGALTPLVRDDRVYGGVQMSRDGSTFAYNLSDDDRPADLHASDASFKSVRRLSEINPWIAAKALPKSELVAYRDADGKPLYGVLRYPVDYQKGQKYPTVFEIYETFFDNGFNSRAAFLANHGYAVFHPSVNLVIGRPGEAWVKGVTSAANRLIDMGIADPDRLGVHGTSYGGYATALLITQTDRFKAAINISGKVNMVSFYTDSPRLGVRNTHAPEKSQDRIGGTLWEYPERYLEHSAVLHADRVKTPLLNITGDQDPNVPASQSREMYYALRRLGKDVEWVRYVNGGHRPPNSVEETVDFEQRILGWYDKYLKKTDADRKKTESQVSAGR
jgi:dipeptidyl aminopeptidase/acylaminoacyl peptidase